MVVMSAGSAHTGGQGTATAEDRPPSSTTTSGAKLSKAGRWKQQPGQPECNILPPQVGERGEL